MNSIREELFRDGFEQLTGLEKQNQQNIEDARIFIGGELRSDYIKLRELNGERLKKMRTELLELQQILQMLEL